MGFKALNQAGDAVYSFTMDNHQWKDLKSNHKQQYKMSCCEAVAIPKASKYGTQFFAHKASSCGAGESIQHQFIKYLALRALHDNGWNADTEVRFNNGDFIADVYAEKDGRKLAIEVQWSNIDADELDRRHQKYINAGIKCVWLCRSKVGGGTFKKPIFNMGMVNNESLVIGGVYDFKSNSKRTLSMCEFISSITNNKINKVSNSLNLLAKIEYKRYKCADCDGLTAVFQGYKKFIELNGVSHHFTAQDVTVMAPDQYQVDGLPCLKSDSFICGHCNSLKPKSNGYSTVISSNAFYFKFNDLNSYYNYWVNIS